MALNQQLNFKIRDVFSENEQLKAELAEVKYRLELKEKNEFKLSNKIKALERAISGVNGRSTSVKENVKPISSDNEVQFLIESKL